MDRFSKDQLFLILDFLNYEHELADPSERQAILIVRDKALASLIVLNEAETQGAA